MAAYEEYDEVLVEDDIGIEPEEDENANENVTESYGSGINATKVNNRDNGDDKDNEENDDDDDNDDENEREQIIVSNDPKKQAMIDFITKNPTLQKLNAELDDSDDEIDKEKKKLKKHYQKNYNVLFDTKNYEETHRPEDDDDEEFYNFNYNNNYENATTTTTTPSSKSTKTTKGIQRRDDKGNKDNERDAAKAEIKTTAVPPSLPAAGIKKKENIRIEPYNLKEERREGFFDQYMNYHRNSRREISYKDDAYMAYLEDMENDNTLQQHDKTGEDLNVITNQNLIDKHLAKYASERNIIQHQQLDDEQNNRDSAEDSRREARPDRSNSATDQVETAADQIQQQQQEDTEIDFVNYWRKLSDYMSRNDETVEQCIVRLGAKKPQTVEEKAKKQQQKLKPWHKNRKRTLSEMNSNDEGQAQTSETNSLEPTSKRTRISQDSHRTKHRAKRSWEITEDDDKPLSNLNENKNDNERQNHKPMEIATTITHPDDDDDLFAMDEGTTPQQKQPQPQPQPQAKENTSNQLGNESTSKNAKFDEFCEIVAILLSHGDLEIYTVTKEELEKRILYVEQPELFGDVEPPIEQENHHNNNQ